MSTVLILSFSDLANDPRVNRQIRFLNGPYDVIAAGHAPPNVPGVSFCRIGITPAQPAGVRPQNLLVRKAAGAVRRIRTAMRKIMGGIGPRVGAAEWAYWDYANYQAVYQQLASRRADLIIANDVPTLPIACRLAQDWKSKVLFDAHEFAPREYEEMARWRWFEAPLIRYLCKQYIPRVDAMITVCPGIADAYHELLGVRAGVVTNAPEYHDLPVRPHREDQPVRMVHHGGISRSRKLENMIHMLDHLDRRFELNLVLVGSDLPYRRQLEELASRTGRVRFLSPVGMRELPTFLNQFDVGLYLLEPLNFNNLHSLPNKLFEFIQARLAVAIGASPEMAAVVRRTRVGVVGPDFQPHTLAALMNPLTSADINRFKSNANAVAWEMSAEANRKIVLDLCQRLCPPRRDGRAELAA